MLSRAWFPGEGRPALRRTVPAAILLTLMLLGCSLLLPCSNAQPPQAAPRAAADIPSQEEMLRRLPPGMPAEQRDRMLHMMERYREQMKRMREMAPGPVGARMPPGPLAQGGFPLYPGATQATLPRLGARVGKPSATLVAQLDLPRGQGLVLEDITAKSAAAKAGLKAHDILLELDGKAVTSNASEFAQQLAKVKEDVAVSAVVLRQGKNETIKGLKLPKSGAAPAFVPGRFQPPVPQLPPVPPVNMAAPMPAPVFAAMPPMGPFGNGVLTTTFRNQDRFVLRHQEGSLVITVVGKIGDGKAAISQIHVQDFRQSNQYDAVDKVPELYRDKVKDMIETVRKNSVRFDVKAR